MTDHVNISKQECIPVGCVPSAAVAFSGVGRGCLPEGGVCLRGDVYLRGVYTPPGSRGRSPSPCGKNS